MSRLALLVAASSLLRPALTMLDYLPSGHPLVAEGSAQPGVSLSSLGLGMPGSPEFEAQYRKLLGVLVRGCQITTFGLVKRILYVQDMPHPI